MAHHNPTLCSWLDIGKAPAHIDLRSVSGRQEFRYLFPSGAVVIEGYRKETALRLGLSHEQLRECCSTSLCARSPPFARHRRRLRFRARSADTGIRRTAQSRGSPEAALCSCRCGDRDACHIGLAAAVASRALSGSGCELEIPMADAASYWSQVVRATKPSESANSDIFVAGDGLRSRLWFLDRSSVSN